MTEAASRTPGPTEAPPPYATRARERPEELIVYQHSNLVYWWPVWLWGYACAALSYLYGVGVPQLASAQDKVILFYPAPWLGWSFIGVTLFVILFTNVRARGIYSLVLLGVIVLLVWFVPKIPGMDHALSAWLPLLRIHLNVAFYLTFSVLLMLIWLFVGFGVDHFTWVRFTTGQVAEEHLFGQATAHVYPAEGMIVRRLPDDFFRHKLLGLRFLRLGTGDLLVRPLHGETFELHNVWHANRKQGRIEQLLRTKETQSNAR